MTLRTALIACGLWTLTLGSVALAQDEMESIRRFDVVTLTDDRSLTGTIVKQNSETIWIDVGFDVVAVPRSSVQSVLRADADGSTGATRDGKGFFSVADDLPESTPNELSKKIGEAVILVSTPSGLGSGFIIHPDGYAITNAHVIQGEQQLKATLFEQGEREFRRVVLDDVEILAVNNHTDLALIKIKRPENDPRPFKFVYVQGMESLESGQEVFAIGNPLGLERSLSKGVVATTNRNFEGLTFIQTTTQINPGNSGGPLFNLQGEVIGVTNMGIPAGEGLGFAIPARYVRDFLRNHDAFAYDKDNPNSGYSYKAAPPRSEFGPPPMLDDDTADQ